MKRSRRRIPTSAAPARLFCAVLAGDRPLLAEARAALAGTSGEIALESEVWPFSYSDYYEPEMGTDLLRQYLVFSRAIDPGELAAIKLHTIALEEQFTDEAGCRRVNLDPGYLTPAKLVLASTKNYSHRIYLSDGIYAEITLTFKRGDVVTYPWTYADYAGPEARRFLLDARKQVAIDSPNRF